MSFWSQAGRAFLGTTLAILTMEVVVWLLLPLVRMAR
jgi:hypothetical protein